MPFLESSFLFSRIHLESNFKKKTKYNEQGSNYTTKSYTKCYTAQYRFTRLILLKFH